MQPDWLMTLIANWDDTVYASGALWFRSDNFYGGGISFLL
jgi:hypothetical protein